MPIDLTHESLITFSELAATLPARRRNRPVHVSTVHRWRSPGLRGIRLEAIRVGGAWHTTTEAFVRFCERLTDMDEPGTVVTTAERRAAHQGADEALSQENW